MIDQDFPADTLCEAALFRALSSTFTGRLTGDPFLLQTKRLDKLVFCLVSLLIVNLRKNRNDPVVFATAARPTTPLGNGSVTSAVHWFISISINIYLYALCVCLQYLVATAVGCDSTTIKLDLI